jgi:acyl-CoA reductase-like NAD-dependent aldehyde dehydrogenase
MTVLGHRLWINGPWTDAEAGQETLVSPYDGQMVASVDLALKRQMEAALQAARTAFSTYRR